MYFVFKGGVYVMMLFVVCEFVCYGICVCMIVFGIMEILMLMGFL